MDQLTSEQLSEWEAYDRLDPIGAGREDYRWANLLSTITNLAICVHGKKGAKLTTIDEFIIDWYPEDKEQVVPVQSVEEMKKTLMGIAKRAGIKKGPRKPKPIQPKEVPNE